MKEFFGFGTGEYDYGRAPEGYMSWQHIVFVTTFIVAMVALAVILGLHFKRKGEKDKNKVLMWSAFVIDGFEIVKIIVGTIHQLDYWRVSLPLFLCSLQLIAIPLAAFTKGRIKEALLDFVFIFGLLGGMLGTFGAAQNYSAYPVLSWPNLVSTVTHCVSGFASLYIVISGMASMKKNNIYITFAILLGFSVIAYIANILLDYNYMFLMRSDGTPYEMFYQLVGGNPILYPLLVVLLFVLYIIVFYAVFLYIKKKKLSK